MKISFRLVACVASSLAFLATACGPAVEQEISNDADILSSGGFSQTGDASHYGVGDGFHGRRTASGEVFNAYGMSAAHRTLKFGTCLLVTNLGNKKTARVRVNDRGPYSGGRILDLSYGAAKVLGVVSSGVARVRIEKVSCTGDVAATTTTNSTPVDNQNCKVYLSVNAKNNSYVSVTVQSRAADGEDRPCGKTLRVSGSGSAAQAKSLAYAQVVAGNGRVTLQIPLSELSGISHVYAEALDGSGNNRGQSEAKQLMLNVSASGLPTPPSASDSDSTPASMNPSVSDSKPVSAYLSL